MVSLRSRGPAELGRPTAGRHADACLPLWISMFPMLKYSFDKLDHLGFGPVAVMVGSAAADEAAVAAVRLNVHGDIGIRADLITTVL